MKSRQGRQGMLSSLAGLGGFVCPVDPALKRRAVLKARGAAAAAAKTVGIGTRGIQPILILGGILIYCEQTRELWQPVSTTIPTI